MTQSSHSISIGVIADDFTGASDIANTFARGGLRTVLTIGLPRVERDYDSPEALVVALKSRSIPPAEAVATSLAALEALQARGARHIFFKYCSTFDSTAEGNIGPVADALSQRLGMPLTLHCPAFPASGRRVFGGYLFVGDELLSESGMRDHPITPMRDANLVRVLQAQTPNRVGRIDFETVRGGRKALGAAIAEAIRGGMRHAIVDAVSEADLRALGGAVLDARLPLVAGGSGVALGFGGNVRAKSSLDERGGSADVPAVSGSAAILAGSCSQMTRAQIAFARDRMPLLNLSERSFDAPEQRVSEALAWAERELGDRPILIVASDTPERVAENQRRYGAGEASVRVERVLAEIARGLQQRGVRRLVVAGGETSGAVVERLGIDALRIGRQIDPGVPWTTSFDDPPLALALKSGNFGAEDFFTRAYTVVP